MRTVEHPLTTTSVTAVMARQNFAPNFWQKVVQNIAKNFGQFSRRSDVSSLIIAHNLHTGLFARFCLFYSILFTFGPGRRGDLGQHSHIGHGRPVVAVGGNWFNQPVTI